MLINAHVHTCLNAPLAQPFENEETEEEEEEQEEGTDGASYHLTSSLWPR